MMATASFSRRYFYLSSWLICWNGMVVSGRTFSFSSVSIPSSSSFSNLKYATPGLTKLSLTEYLEFYQKKDVLIVGDGDFAFARDISKVSGYNSLIASTIDHKDDLFRKFPSASENIREIERNGGKIQYGVDATNINDKTEKYDIIAWNFPHIRGKQNIRHNRELLRKFFQSIQCKLRDNGSLFLALCDKQSGVSATSKLEWDYSWKLVEQLCNTKLLLTDHYDFDALEWPSYRPTGLRGRSKEFKAGNSRLYRIEKISNQKSLLALQAPVFTLEVPLLSQDIILDIHQLKMRTVKAIKSILTASSLEDYFWSVMFVDFFTGRETNQYFYTIEIGFTSLQEPLDRQKVESFRILLQEQLPKLLGLSTDSSRAYQHVSRPMPWFVAAELKRRYEEDFDITPSSSVFLLLRQLKMIPLEEKDHRKSISLAIAQQFWNCRAAAILQETKGDNIKT